MPVIIGEWYYSALNNLKEQLALFIKFKRDIPRYPAGRRKVQKTREVLAYLHPSAVKN
jgi:hypothetical protein